MVTDASAHLLRAAELAERAAAKAADEPARDWPTLATVVADHFYDKPGFGALVRASGPSHWGAVAAALRTVIEMSVREVGVTEFGLNEYGRGRAAGLGEVRAALLPLADQIITDLGDTNG